MNEPGVVASLFKDMLYALFFSEVLLADELDLKTIFRSNPFGILPELIAKGFCKTWVVEDANMLIAQVASHPLSITECGQSPLDHYTIETGEGSQDLLSVTVYQKFHRYPPP